MSTPKKLSTPKMSTPETSTVSKCTFPKCILLLLQMTKKKHVTFFALACILSCLWCGHF